MSENEMSYNDENRINLQTIWKLLIKLKMHDISTISFLSVYIPQSLVTWKCVLCHLGPCYKCRTQGYPDLSTKSEATI